MASWRAWKLIVGCSVWPAVLPVLHWWPMWRNFDAIFPVGLFSSFAREGLHQLMVTQLILSVATAFVLGMVLCVAIEHRLEGQRPLPIRIIIDTAVLVCLAVAPWLATRAVFGASTVSFLDFWVDLGAPQIPALSALLAGISFWIARRRTLARSVIGAA